MMGLACYVGNCLSLLFVDCLGNSWQRWLELPLRAKLDLGVMATKVLLLIPENLRLHRMDVTFECS